MSATQRRIPGPERREQILTTARRLFAERGYDDFNVDEVAAMVNPEIETPRLGAM